MQCNFLQKVILPITLLKHCSSPGLKESAVFFLHSWGSGSLYFSYLIVYLGASTKLPWVAL